MASNSNQDWPKGFGLVHIQCENGQSVNIRELLQKASVESVEMILIKEGFNTNDPEIKAVISKRAEELVASNMEKIESLSVSSGVLDLIRSNKKKKIKRLAYTVTVSKRDIPALIVNAQKMGLEHKIYKTEYLPKDLSFDPSSIPEMMGSKDKRTTRKVMKGVSKIFKERRIWVFHLFEDFEDGDKWFAIYFDILRDLDPSLNNHWTEGQHIHFTSNAFSTKKHFMECLKKEKFKVKGVHIKASLRDQ